MSVTNFFKAKEDHSAYHDVCDLRKGDRTPTNIHKAFEGLKCTGNEVHEWTSQRRDYIDNFKKAKQCVERRISTMKDFGAHSAKNKTSRKKHIYPIQVAYTYGKDCLKKFATRKQQNAFRNSVNELIDNVSAERKNVRGYFGNSIENSIRGRNNIANIQELLNKQYYNDEQLELINKARKVGNNESKLSPNNRVKYMSLFNVGFSRGNDAAAAAINAAAALENDSNSDSENESMAASASASAPRHRKHKKKSKTMKRVTSLTPNENANRALEAAAEPNLNALEAEINKRFDKLEKLCTEKSLIDEKMFYIEDIYHSALLTVNKVNANVVQKEAALRNLGIKAMGKKLAANERYMNSLAAVKQRTELRTSIEKVHQALKEKLAKVTKEIDEALESGNHTIDSIVENYYLLQLPKVLTTKAQLEIDELPEDERIKYQEEFNELSKIKLIFESINTELLEVEVNLNKLHLRQTKLQELIERNAIKNRPEIVKDTQTKIDAIKLEQATLYRELIRLYKKKTDKIRDILQQVSSKYKNPYVLLQNLKSGALKGLASLLLGL